MITNTELEHKGNLYPTALISYEHDQDTISFITKNGVRLQIQVLRDSMLRLRYSTTGIFEHDFSYAIDENHPHGFNQLKINEDRNPYRYNNRKIYL